MSEAAFLDAQDVKRSAPDSTRYTGDPISAFAGLLDICNDVKAKNRARAQREAAAYPVPAPRTAPSMSAYRQLLAAHDWHHARSDDYSVYCAGRDQLAALRAMQQELDPSFETWNQCCPPDFAVRT